MKQIFWCLVIACTLAACTSPDSGSGGLGGPNFVPPSPPTTIPSGPLP